jgi:hypothetical protein
VYFIIETSIAYVFCEYKEKDPIYSRQPVPDIPVITNENEIG